MLSRLSGVMVSVLAIVPKIRGFKPHRSDGLLRAIKFHNKDSFGGKVKPSVQCHKILQHVKNHFEVWTKIFRRPNSLSSPNYSWFPTRWLFVVLPDSSGGQIGSFPCRYHSTIVLRAHISPLGWTIAPLVAAVQRRSLIPSTWCHDRHQLTLILLPPMRFSRLPCWYIFMT
jgi:hypothetical protein